MATFTKAEIQRAIDQARKHLARRKEPRAPKRTPLPSERAATRLASEWMKSSGLDLKTLNALRNQHRKELDSVLPKRTVEAAKRWSKQIRATQAEVATRLRNVHAVPPAGNLVPPRLLLVDTPIGLIASDNAIIESKRIEAQKSIAKMRVDRRSPSTDQASFLFLFRNELSAPFLFNFLAVHSISGHANLWIDGNPSFSFSLDYGRVSVDVRVDVAPEPLTTDSSQVLDLQGAALNGPSYWENETLDRTFSRGGFLTANGVILHPGESAIIMVTTVVKTELTDGHLVLDFNEGDFGFRCPGVLVVPRQQLLQVSGLPDLVLTTV